MTDCSANAEETLTWRQVVLTPSLYNLHVITSAYLGNRQVNKSPLSKADKGLLITSV
jgi:hypothetical protein